MRKKRAIGLFSVVGSLMVLGGLAAVLLSPADPAVLKIGADTVTESEFLMVFNHEYRAGLLASADTTLADPWDSEYQGGSLREHALEVTADRMLTYKAEQRVFAAYDVCDWSYKWFLKEYKNQKKAGDGAGEIKYGSTFSSEYDYYVYLSSRYRLQVIDKLKEAGEAQDVYNYYLQNPDEFRESESFVFDYYSVPLTQENADSLLEQAAAGTETPEVTYRKITLDGYTSKYEQGLIVDIDDQMETLRVPGAMLTLENETERFVVRTVSYAQGEVRDFADCREQAANRYYQQEYDRLVEEEKAAVSPQTTRWYDKIEIS